MFRRFSLMVLVALLSVLPLAGQPPAGKKFALLVGVNEYKSAKLAKLDYAERDVDELAKLLQEHGYEVTLLKGRKADKQGVQNALETMTRNRERGDLLLVGLAGHGVFLEKLGSCFCPHDSDFTAPETTMLTMTAVLDRLGNCSAGTKLLLVDACRDDPGRGARGIDQVPQVPAGVGVLLSCSAGQRSFEPAALKHGLFFHHILEGLRGKAKTEDNEVTWDQLRAYVKRRVPKDVETYVGGGGKQVPQEIANLTDVPPLLNLKPMDEGEGKGKKFAGHTEAITSVAFSADGRYGVSGSSDTTVRVWDLARGTEEKLLKGHTKQVRSVAFRPGTQQALSASLDGSVRLWDVKSGDEVRSFPHERGVNSMAVSRNGEALATGSDDSTVYLWNIQTGKETKRFRQIGKETKGPMKTFDCVAFSADGQYLAAGDADDLIYGFDLAAKMRRWRASGAMRPATNLGFSPDGETLYAYGHGAVSYYERATGKQLLSRVYKSDNKTSILSMILSSDGKRVYTGGDDKIIRVWDADGKELHKFEGHSSAVTCLALSADGRRLLSGSSDRTVRLWDLPSP